MSLERLKDKVKGAVAGPDAGQKPLVVIVDDNTDVLLSLRSLLRMRYDIVTSTSAATAVDIIRSHNPKAVILDIKMPDHDGFWAFREIRKFNETVPVIFNSGYQDAVDDDTLFGGYRPFAYMVKGGNVNSFLEIISRAVDGNGAQGNSPTG